MTDRWLELVGDPAIRTVLILGLGGAWGIFGWLVGQWSIAQRLPEGIRPMYSAMVGGVGIPVGFLLSEIIPGLGAKEVVVVFAGLGTGVPWVTHATLGKKADETKLFRARSPKGDDQ